MTKHADPQGPEAAPVVPDFIFGTLATDELRLQSLRAERAGLWHDQTLLPSDPRPGEPIVITVFAGPDVDADRVTLYYTTDGSDPAGRRGEATSGAAMPLERVAVEWDTLLWGYRDCWRGAIPPQVEGCEVRYVVEAWHSAGTGSRYTGAAGFGASGMVADSAPGGAAGAPEPTPAQGHEAGDHALLPDHGAILTGVVPPPAHEEGEGRVAGTASLAVPAPVAPAGPSARPQIYGFRVDREEVPGWLRDAVIYHIFMDRFAPDPGLELVTPADPLAGFYGGTLRGVTARLDYLAQLGATCLWLSPIFPSPTHHGYDSTDYLRVEPRLGDEQDFRALVEEAHRRGMRVILDFTANHCSSLHPAFVAAQQDQSSDYAGWFTFEQWPERYRSFFGVPEMPQLDVDHAPARDYLIASARRWLELGCDGFRLDYANGPSHAFWSAFRAATRAAHPESATLGEVVETPALQRSYEGRMDGCLDFLLLQALRSFFSFHTMAPSALDSFLRRHDEFFPPGFVLASFLDNHDMNRFLWTVGGDLRRLRLAALCQFTLPGPPIVYYGTEVGLSQQRDVRYPDTSGHPEEARRPMLWDDAQDAALLDFYRALVRLRREGAAVWRTTRQTILADDARWLYAYACGPYTVVLNNGDSEAVVELGERPGRTLALATDPACALGSAQVTLPPYAGACLKG